jgi:parvulin-like peptidyl-prolyl isomerase
MLKTITITNEDILQHAKLSCKMTELSEGVVNRKIIAEAVGELGITVELEELQQAADQFRLLNKLKSVEDTWVWLEKNSLSLDDFEELVYSSTIFTKLASHLFKDKIEPYFFENQLDYKGIVMYEVVFNDEDLALELFYAIKESEISFYDVAHKYIQDIELRRKGGYRGILRRKDLKPEISAQVFATKPPQLLKPIVTSLGVHLILVEETIEPQLNMVLRHQIGLELFSDWLKQQISQVEVVTYLD